LKVGTALALYRDANGSVIAVSDGTSNYRVL